MSDQQDKLPPPMAPPRNWMKEKSAFDLSNPGLALIIYNFLFATPFAYTMAILNKKVFQQVGYEKIMPCPSGILGTKILFVVINLLMIFNWVIQFRAEIREKGNRIKVIGEQIIWWNSEIERLEGMLVEERKRRQRDIDQQLSEDLLHHSPNVMIPNYERNSVVNLDGIREWDFLVGAKSPKGKGLLGKGPSGLKGLLTVKESKLPKLKKGVKKLVGEKEE